MYNTQYNTVYIKFIHTIDAIVTVYIATYDKMFFMAIPMIAFPRVRSMFIYIIIIIYNNIIIICVTCASMRGA